MRLNIRHETRYDYDQPVTYSVQRLHLTPPSFAGQKVIAWSYLDHDDVYQVRTQSGGGYGDPLDRDATQVASDVATGHISAKAARAEYGVVLDRSSGSADVRATQKLRDRVRANRKKSRKPTRKSARR